MNYISLHVKFRTTSVQITSRIFNQNYKGAEVSHGCAENKQFSQHNSKQPLQPLTEEPLT